MSVDLGKTIKEAVYYAERHLYLEKGDEVYFTNLLLHHFGLFEPYEGPIDERAIDAYAVPDAIFNAFVAYDIEKGLDEGAASRDATWVFGILSPRPSEVARTFATYYDISGKTATEYLYDLSIKNDYIAKTQVDKNLHWDATFKGEPPLEISINLSKPEKNNKDIAKLLTKASTSYPKCLLCEENIGFAGSPSHPARENIRFVPVTLDGGRWFLQYSPYVYYDRHCICFYQEHVPMAINEHILRCLFDFVDQFPHFFIGSNSDLPIVGGSILNHEHFQGGAHLLPLLKAPERRLLHTSEKGTKVSIVDFYDTALRLSGSSREDIVALGNKILLAWRSYDDPSHEILAKEGAVQHSTVTPLLRKEGAEYQLTFVLRNNRTSAEYPDGIFHVHPEYQAIKKEGIGLIEAAGLFILPARLKRQCAEVSEVVAKHLSKEDYLKLYPDLEAFGAMIETLQKTGESAESYLNAVGQKILDNVAVYKNNPKDQAALAAFVKGALK
jgi:UDPglucose--hexose-1-phosphate uridylyltransferase